VLEHAWLTVSARICGPSRYEKRLLRYLEDLIREMDRKIAKSKDRAEKESAPRPIKADDQLRLDELQQRARGEPTSVLG
jgi:hypothetical protein